MAMVRMAPHGALTFVSTLFEGSMSDREVFRQSGITSLLTPDMAIMVDKRFLVDDLVPGTVHRPCLLSKWTQMSEEDVLKTQSIARLRVHVRRVKENKLFDTTLHCRQHKPTFHSCLSPFKLPKWTSGQEMEIGSVIL